MAATPTTVMWRTGFGSAVTHALIYGTRKTACGWSATPYLFLPTRDDSLCRPCACALDEHAWGGEDPEICMDCGVVR